MTATERIDHPFDPVFDGNSRVLLLGTMPSPKSRETGFYYGHPQNRFWKVLAALFDEPVPDTNERRRDFCLRNHIALWDVLAACDISGASDASIGNAQANDLRRVLDRAPIGAVFCTGAKSAELYARACEPATGIPAAKLPSTSPANAAFKLDDLVVAYAPVKEAARPYTPPALDVPDVVALERTIAERGTPLAELMHRAGLALAHRARALAPERANIVVLCGSGNNGGDGWVAAVELASRGFNVTLVTRREPSRIKSQPAHDAAIEAQRLLGSLEARITVDPAPEGLASAIDGADVIIDALLGTGFDGESVKEPSASWIAAANRQRERGARIVSADVPSGLSARTGHAADPCIRADATVTMIVPKPGLGKADGPTCCGTVHVAPLAYIEPLLKAAN